MSENPEDLVELYAAANAVEARRVVLFLEDEGIEALAREPTGTTLPLTADAPVLVLVRRSDRAQARAIVEAAVQDGAISTGGQLLG